MANFSIKQSFLFVTAFCMLSSPLLALAKIHIRQTSTSVASVSGSNAVVVKSSTSSLISNVLYPALRTILSAPIKFIQQLLLDIRQFLGAHNFRDIFNIKFLRMAFTKIPSRLMGYWSSFMEVEMECIRRTFCDMSDYTSPRVPAWLHQILVIYFTTFSQDNVYYQALANGMINHNCPLLYSKCDPQLFMTRMSNNLTNTFNSTVGPLRDAFNELMHVTASTIGHIESTTPIPSAISLNRPQLSNEDETENEEEDNEIVERGHNTFRNGSFRKSDHNPADNDEEDNLLDRSRSNSELNGSQNNNNEEDEDNEEDQQNNNAGSRLSPKPDNFAPNAVIPPQAHHHKAHHLNNPSNQPINNNRFMTPIVSSQEQFVRTGHHSRQQ